MVMSVLRSWQPASGVKSVGLSHLEWGEIIHPQIAEERDGNEFVVLSLGFKCYTHPPQTFLFLFLISTVWLHHQSA